MHTGKRLQSHRLQETADETVSSASLKLSPKIKVLKHFDLHKLPMTVRSKCFKNTTAANPQHKSKDQNTVTATDAQ